MNITNMLNKKDILEIQKILQEQQLENRLLFHGSSNVNIQKILNDGMRTTDMINGFDTFDVSHVYYGSYFGTLKNAILYAQDTTIHRHHDEINIFPSVIITDIENLAKSYNILPDYQSLEFPITRRRNHLKILDTWSANYHTLTYNESLSDVGCVFVEHETNLPADLFRIIQSLDDLNAYIAELDNEPILTMKM